MTRLADGVLAYRDHPVHRSLEEPPAVWREGNTRVLDFGATHRAARGKGVRAVLVVPSLINRWEVLDLTADKSLLRAMAAQGLRPYLVDWGTPDAEERRFDLATYIARLDRALAFVAKRARRRPAVMGYCMGGTLSVMFAARHADKLRGLVLLGTPVEFRLSGELYDLTDRRRFDADLLMDVLGNMPPFMMQSGFKLLNPLDAVNKLTSLLRDAGDGERVRHFVALESWLDDNVAFPGGVYREYIRALYQDDLLCKRIMRIAGTPVDLAKLTAPLLNVIALRDHICAPPASRALMPLVGAKEKEVMEFDTGHIGLTTSRRSLSELWPRIADWMELRA